MVFFHNLSVFYRIDINAVKLHNLVATKLRRHENLLSFGNEEIEGERNKKVHGISRKI